MLDPARKRLLVVDDDPIQLEFYEAVLESEYEVVTACNFNDAIGMLEEGLAVDAFACDHRLDGGHRGTELLAWIHRHRPALLDYSFIMSGELDIDNSSYAVPRLHKPVRPDELLRVMQGLLK